MKHLLTAIFVCTIAVYCMDSNEIRSTSGPSEGWRSIATVSGADSITYTHVHSLLKSHGIVCAIEGNWTGALLFYFFANKSLHFFNYILKILDFL